MHDRTDLELGRRELLVGAAVAAAAVAALPGVGAAAETPKAGAKEDLAKLAATCVQRGEECTSHCLGMFAAGDTSLAGCARSVHEMSAVCGALERLAWLDSTHLRALSPVCAEVCDACEKEGRKPAQEHASGARCAVAGP